MIKVNDAILIRNVMDTPVTIAFIVTAINKDQFTTYITGKTLDGTPVREIDLVVLKELIQAGRAIVFSTYDINILNNLYK